MGRFEFIDGPWRSRATALVVPGVGRRRGVALGGVALGGLLAEGREVGVGYGGVAPDTLNQPLHQTHTNDDDENTTIEHPGLSTGTRTHIKEPRWAGYLCVRLAALAIPEVDGVGVQVADAHLRASKDKGNG